MSGRLQIHKYSNSAKCPVISNQSKLLSKNHKPLVLQPPLVQTKLVINQPGDQSEQEADGVAEQVYADAGRWLLSSASVLSAMRMRMMLCRPKSRPGQVPDNPEAKMCRLSFREVLRSPGQTLWMLSTRALYGAAVWARLQQGAGAHADAEGSGVSCRQVDALAYTLGHEM